VGFCATQIPPEHAKQRLGRHDLAVLQEIENRGHKTPSRRQKKPEIPKAPNSKMLVLAI